jgi:hypothetical protein
MVLTITPYGKQKFRLYRIKGTTETEYAFETDLGKLRAVFFNNLTQVRAGVINHPEAWESGWVRISGLTAGDDLIVEAWGYG